MFEAENKRKRTFVLRVDPEESIVESLRELARSREISEGHVSGFGVLRSATINLPAASGGRTDAFPLEGPFEILALTGRVASNEGEPVVEVSVQLARATDAGLACVGGRVVDAIAEEVELMIVALDETIKHRRERGHPSTAIREEAPSVEATGWAAVAAASEAAEAAPEGRRGGPSGAAEGRHVPARGEFIDHKVFGVCRVEAVKPDGTMIIKLETGRRKQLKLDALEVLAPKTGGNRVIYPVQIRRS
jgi:predicted DNA-binding protein with PD1-like motif